MECCSKHSQIESDLREIKDEKKFWHRLLRSKWCSWIIIGLISLFFSFIGWTVNGVYSQQGSIEKNKQQIESVKQDVKDIKADIKEIKEEIKNDQKERMEQREKDQEKLMRILLEIKKEIKK